MCALNNFDRFLKKILILYQLACPQRRLLIPQEKRYDTYFRAYAPSEDSKQPAQSDTIFSGHIIGLDAKFLHADNGHSDQMSRMPKLIRVFHHENIPIYF